jgi:hypothetical protein
VFWKVLNAQGQQMMTGSNVASAVSVPEKSGLGKLKRMRKLPNGKQETVEQKATLFATEIAVNLPTTLDTTQAATVLVRTEARRLINGKSILIRTKLRKAPAGTEAGWLSFSMPRIQQFKLALIQKQKAALASGTSA